MKKILLIAVLLAVVLGGVLYFNNTQSLQGRVTAACPADVTLTVTDNGPIDGTFAPGQSNVELLNLTFETNKTLFWSKLDFTVNSTGSGLMNNGPATANYTNIRLLSSTNQLLADPLQVNVSGSDASQTFAFLVPNLVFKANQPVTVKFLADVTLEPTLVNTPSVVTGALSPLVEGTHFTVDNSVCRTNSVTLVPVGNIVPNNCTSNCMPADGRITENWNGTYSYWGGSQTAAQ